MTVRTENYIIILDVGKCDISNQWRELLTKYQLLHYDCKKCTTTHTLVCSILSVSRIQRKVCRN